MSICTVVTFLPCAFLVLPLIHQSRRPGDPPFGVVAMTAVLLFHASSISPTLATVRGAAGRVKHLIEMLVEVLRGAASSLACTACL